jgi:hypothetical protein
MVRGSPRIARIDDGSLPVTSYNGKINFSEDHASAYLGSQPLSLSVLSPGSRTTSIFATVSAGPGAPPLSSLRVRLSSHGRSAFLPLSHGVLQVPISLHWGLNRIRLTVAGAVTPTTEVLLSDISLHG